MKLLGTRFTLLLILLGYLMPLSAQDSSVVSAVVPRLINYSGKVVDAEGKLVAGVVGVTFAIYKDQEGGAALWMETQNVHADKSGHYTAQLGSSSPSGLPADLFGSGEARWLGVQVSGQVETPRTLLLSVPYALKAADAETIGGLPPSAFVRVNDTAAKTPAPANATSAATAAAQPAKNSAVTGKGVASYVPMWDSASDIIDSVIFQKGSAIGINTTAPAAPLDVNGKGDMRDTLTLFPKGTDPTLAISGTAFSVASTGKVTFAAGQTFPGTGSVSSVGLAAPSSDFTVSGSPVTKSGTLTMNWTIPPTPDSTPNAIVKRDSSGSITAFGISGTFLAANNTASGGNGVYGEDDSGVGVNGYSAAGGAGVQGVIGTGGSSSSSGVYGQNDSASGGKGVLGISQGSVGFGVQGLAPGSNGMGVVGTNTSFGSVAQGIRGTAPIGVIGDSNGYGVVATSDNSNAFLAKNNSGADAAVIVNAGGGAVLFASGTSGSLFLDGAGNLSLSGTLSAASKNFRIDHPLDPANKYLYHAAIESSEIKNLYDGVAMLDGGGSAVVSLPDWFEAVNGDFRYQLTAVGAPGPNLYIAREISSGQFVIAGGQPGTKVSWQVTGVRHDAFAQAHPLQVSVEKPENERGYYIHPELYGAPAEKSLAAAHLSQQMHQVNHGQEQPATWK
ncbi:MAG: hypothetical protein WAK29_01685 [Terriglobales bacterium]